MKRMTIAIICVTAVAAFGGGYWVAVLRHPADATATSAPADEGDKGTAAVQTAVVRNGSVDQTLTAYGNVTAEPGEVTVLSVQVECRVKELKVSAGQVFTKGAAVIEIEPSPDSKLQLLQAKQALAAAELDAGNAKQRLDMKLATTAENQLAQQAVETAKVKLDDLVNRGAAETTRTVTAPFDGLVGKINVQEGQLLPAGAPLVELIPRGQIEVWLGVEPSQIKSIKVGQAVALFNGKSDKPVTGKVRLVTRRVSPDTRLVDVFVAPDAPADDLLLDSFVRGELTTGSTDGLAVPRSAVLPDGDGFTLFTVVGGKAVKHSVKVLGQDDDTAAVAADDLKIGDIVVVTGNLELDAGTAVEATTAPVTTTEPTTKPAAGEDK